MGFTLTDLALALSQRRKGDGTQLPDDADASTDEDDLAAVTGEVGLGDVVKQLQRLRVEVREGLLRGATVSPS